MLQACRVEQYPFTADQQPRKPDWEQYIAVIASEILKEQGPQTLLRVRSKLYELLVNCIPPEMILSVLSEKLMEKCDDSLKARRHGKRNMGLDLPSCLGSLSSTRQAAQLGTGMRGTRPLVPPPQAVVMPSRQDGKPKQREREEEEKSEIITLS